MAQRSLNKVMLLGHLGKDPEVRYTASQRAVATFSLATSMSWRDQEGAQQERTEWHNIVAWGRLGEICGEHLSKGKQVFIEGRIQSREWQDQEGKKRKTVEIIATDLIMLGGSGQGQSRSSGDAARSQGRDQVKPAPKDRPYSDEDYYQPPPEDDIPF